MVLVTPVNNYVLTVPVVIAGRTYQFMVDTGAAFTILDNRLAASLTEHAAHSDVPAIVRENDAIGTANGVMSSDNITFWRSLPIRLGNREIRNPMPWFGLDLSHVTQATGRQIDGIIGADVIRQWNWLVDNKTGTLTIRQGNPALTDYQRCVPYSTSFGQGPEIAVDMAQDQQVLMQIDTGADDLLASPELLQALRDQHSMVDELSMDHSVGAGGVAESAGYLIDGLALEGARIGKMRAVTAPAGTNNLGMGFLSRLDRYLLSPNQMVFCYVNGDLARDDARPLRFIGVAFAHGRLELAHNDQADLDTYGLQNGDVLLEVNKRDALPVHIDEVRKAINNTPAGKLEIAIERQGARKAVSI